MKRSCLFAFLAALMFVTTSHAAAIRDVTVLSVYSEFSNANDLRHATNLVNGNGLFGDIHVVNPQRTMWLTGPVANPPAGDFTNAFVTFDLGAVRTLDQMRVWNYNEAGAITRRGIQRADIYTSIDGVTFTTNFPNTFFNRASGTFSNFSQTIGLGGTSARFIGFKVLTNYFESSDSRVGLAEVKFYDTNVAPIITFASRSFSGDRVTLTFSDSVSPATATNIANYSITAAGTNATISSAAMDFYPNRVVLQTSTLNSNLVYSVSATNITDTITGAKVSTLPYVIESEVAVWLKADAGVVKDGSDLVSQWSDQSGAGNNVIQGNTAFQPQFIDGVINGKPVLRFNGISNTNYLEAPHASSLVVRSDVSVFAVINPSSLATHNAIIGKTLGNQPAPFDFYTTVNAGRPTFYRGNGSVGSFVGGVSNVVAGSSYILSAVARGTNGTSFMNGAFNAIAAFLAPVGDVGGPMRVGTRADFATRMTGDIAEIILLRGAVSDAERIAITDYLGTKYGIAVVNLVFNQQPQNMAKLEGQTATFRVSVSASSPTINYQWQRAGTNIPNATNVSFTTPVLTLADNNSMYRVLVSIPGSSQFSDAATLTVSADQEKPTIVSAGRNIWDQSKITVVFSERVQWPSAVQSSNYALDNGATVTAASAGEPDDRIVLTTSGLVAGGTYLLTVQNVQDLFGNTIATVQVPVTFYPVAALWLSASSGVTTDGDGYITQWNDLSGNGNHATPLAGAPFTPQLTNGFNSQPVARFDGTNSISLFAPSSASLAIVGDISIYSVAQFVDRVTHNAFVGKTTLNQPASYDFYLGINSGLPSFFRGNGVTGTAVGVPGATAPSLGVPHIVSVVMSGTAVAHFLDGITNGAGTLATTMGDTGESVGIGTRGDGVTKMKGDVAEFLIFGSALSDSDRAALDAYFGTLYGVLIGELPKLTIVASPGSVLLSWPNTAGFGLESSPTAGGTWTAITTGVVSENGTNSISILTTENQQFYQLRKP